MPRRLLAGNPDFLDMPIKWERVYSGRIPFVFRTITGLIQASRRCLAGCSPCGGLLHFVRTAGYIKARARLVQAFTLLVLKEQVHPTQDGSQEEEDCAKRYEAAKEVKEVQGQNTP